MHVSVTIKSLKRILLLSFYREDPNVSIPSKPLSRRAPIFDLECEPFLTFPLTKAKIVSPRTTDR